MGRPKTNKPELVSVKLPADVIETARIVAALNSKPVAELLGEILRPILAKREADGLAERAKRTKTEK